jgi:hypothetical protein
MKLLKAGFIILVCCLFTLSQKIEAQTVQAGIFHSGGTLTVNAKPSANITAGAFSNCVVTIRWASSYTGATLGTITDGTMTTGQNFGWAKNGGEVTSGSYVYQNFMCVPSAGSITWTAGNEYFLFSVSVSGGTGTGLIEIVDDAYTSAPFPSLDWYFEVGGLDYTDYGTPFYQGGASNVPLPVELSSLTASVNDLAAELKWSTATEVNNYGFEIERRTVSDQLSAVSSWQKVGFVNGNGTSNIQHSYSFSENITVSGTYAYRLKQIDNNGSFKYSQETEVTIEVPKVFTLSQNYPNPFNPTTNIEFTMATDGKAVLKVYNALGQEVAELFNGEAQAGRIIQTHFDASRLASGVYFSRLEADGKSLVKRMMFVK